jgi:hypothetical protein
MLGDVPCPTNPPPPPGTIIWTQAVSKNLESWAVGVLNNPTDFPMLAVAYAVVDGVPVVGRVEHHTWIGKTGQKGVCIRGITLYHPTAVPFVPVDIPSPTAVGIAPRGAQTTGASGAELIGLLGFAIVAFTSAYGIAAAILHHPPHHGL